MEIYFYKNCTSKEPEPIHFDTLVSCLRTSNNLKITTEQFRNSVLYDRQHDTSTAHRVKQNAPAFLTAAYVKDARLTQNVTALTGLVMCDFDHIPLERLDEVRQCVNADAHTLLSYVTLSGEGLRVVACYEANLEGTATKLRGRYKRAFETANQYYSQLTGLEFDAACKDMVRLSCAAYDPDTFYRPDATPFSQDDMRTEKERAEEVYAPIRAEKRREEKEDRRQRNQALHQIDQTYRYKIQKSLSNQGIRFEAGSHNEYVMRVGYLLNKYGLSPECAADWAEKEFGSEYPEARSVVESCYNRIEEFGLWSHEVSRYTGSGNGHGRMPVATYQEIIEFLKSKIEWRYNLILNQPEIKWLTPVNEASDSIHSKDPNQYQSEIEFSLNSLLIQMEREMGLRTTARDLRIVIESKETKEYDPALAYLKSLPEWHESDPDYLGELADSIEILDENPRAKELFRRMLTKYLVSMVRGWITPYPNNYMLVLTGAQGTRKSTWVGHLMPPELSEYVRTKQDSASLNKDDIIALSSNLLEIHEEMDALGEKETSVLKAMITAPNSKERAAYRRDAVLRRHIASLCATCNSDYFITDRTGSRRMLAFRVNVVKSPISYPFNYEGIYAQAYAMVRNGFNANLTDEEMVEMADHNQQFMTVDYEASLIPVIFRKPGPSETGKWMPLAMIAERLRNYNHGAHIDTGNLDKVLDKLGFEKKTKGRNRVLGYVLEENRMEETEALLRRLALQEDF